MPSPFVELEVGKRTVKVTNPDKIFFRTRGETKLDLVRYYFAVDGGIVRALYERPTQLKRHPDGAEGEAIYQKRVPEKRRSGASSRSGARRSRNSSFRFAATAAEPT